MLFSSKCFVAYIALANALKIRKGWNAISVSAIGICVSRKSQKSTSRLRRMLQSRQNAKQISNYGIHISLHYNSVICINI